MITPKYKPLEQDIEGSDGSRNILVYLFCYFKA